MEPLLTRVDELQHLGEKLTGVMVPQWLGGEELLGSLEGGELVRGPEVVVAVVARSGEDVGHPAGGRLWQDSGDESEAVPLGRRAA